MAKAVDLAVHRNTIEARRKRELARDVAGRTLKLARDNDIRAWAFVGLDAKGKAHALWDTGAILPLWAFADTIGNALRRDIEESGVAEDWRPALTLKGGA
jgi:hypothetical protein